MISSRLLNLCRILVLSCAVFGAGSEALAQPPVVNAYAALAAPGGYEGRIRLVRYLDEPDGYCLDIPGSLTFLLPVPPWAHTCHFDRLADQVFKYNKDGKRNIRWTYSDEKNSYDWCLTAKSAQDGANFEYVACNKPELQAFEYSSIGEFKLQNTNLCIFVESTGPRAGAMTLSGGVDPYGRGRSVNPAYSHLARLLELHPCGTGEPSMARWQAVVE